MGNVVQKVVAIARRNGILRPRDLIAHRIPRQYLRLACQRGLLDRIGRGLYRAQTTLAMEHQSIAEVCKKVPSGVICLLSALRFHDLTSQNPFDVWLAIGEKSHLPRIDTVAVRIARFSKASLHEGVESHKVGGVVIKVFSPAKTVADCFKYRNKIGIDIAIEALRDVIRQRKATVDRLVHFASICRVERIMSPYLEAIL